MIDLKNLNIVLTGSTGVIGNSILHNLINAGSNVLATGTNEEKLKNIKDKYKNLNVLKFDISDHKNIEKFVEDSNKILSNKIDVLINNAGITMDNLSRIELPITPVAPVKITFTFFKSNIILNFIKIFNIIYLN